MARRVQIDPCVYLIGAAWLLLLPLRWALGALLAMGVHELFHCAFVWIVGGDIQEFRIGPGGMCIETSPMEPLLQVICAMAGPLGSFLMLLLARVYPEAALWGAVQGIFNLLPVYPLDGGRVMSLLLPEKLCRILEWIIFVLIIIFSGAMTIGFHLGMIGLLPGILIGWKLGKRKIPCIAAKLGVQ